MAATPDTIERETKLQGMGVSRGRKEGDSLRWLSRLMWFTTNKAAADRYAALAVAILEPLAPGRELAMALVQKLLAGVK
jgi:hypothetical protein